MSTNDRPPPGPSIAGYFATAVAYEQAVRRWGWTAVRARPAEEQAPPAQESAGQQRARHAAERQALRRREAEERRARRDEARRQRESARARPASGWASDLIQPTIPKSWGA